MAKGKRVFYNGKIDHEGLAYLPNLAKTRIKKQVGGGKQPATKAIKDSDIKSLSDMAPTPTPMQPHATKWKGVKGSIPDAAEDRNSPLPITLPKAVVGRKRVEIILTSKKATRKAICKVTMSRPTMITISSGSNDNPEETPAGDGPKKTSVDHSEAFLSEEQAPSTRKHKVEGPDSPRAMKRATPDRHTNQLSESKGTHKSSQTRPVTKKTRFRILSPLDTESLDEDETTVNGLRIVKPLLVHPWQNLIAWKVNHCYLRLSTKLISCHFAH